MEEAEAIIEDAEVKFNERDYSGAVWLAEMAQDTFPNLHGIQQYVAAYRVHVAAYESEIKTIVASRTNDPNTPWNHKFCEVSIPDWYGVLDILDGDVDCVDSDMIKKQYKRMALLLHPDKNGSVVAESAFKLVQEAVDVLSDPDKRMGFNIKRTRSRPMQEHRAQTSSASTSYSKQKTYTKQDASTSSKQRNTKPAAKEKNTKPEKTKRQDPEHEAGHSTSYYNYDPQDAWGDEEEEEGGEEGRKKGIRLCPTCGYPQYVQTNQKTSSSVLSCGSCEREFIFF
ncbi:dnaJ homolog subfamily B member 5-like [Papaver somniferum]|uniref:dnaJ homolog subfamily B member 5-like n=1 Tax=Papaver somniferum TaxID=3469 RepID=UPI000E7035C8|nr:dnaJ homolog subfamily B member 5-like [Papaver somniferum]